MSDTTELREKGLETANERFKESFRQWFWGSMIAATAVHFAVFALFPELTAADMSLRADVMEPIPPPPEVDIPERPEPLERPAMPVVSDAPIEDDITMAPTTLDAYRAEPVERPVERSEDLSDGPVFTPWTVAPAMVNGREVQRALEREYPSSLRAAGIGGEVRVWLYVDTLGVVRDQRIQLPSGYDAFDQAALNVAKVARFSPAQNLDQKVPVWVEQVITFRVR